MLILPKPRYRSHSFKKVQRVTKSGRNVTHYRRGKNAEPKCGICGAELNGIGTRGGKSRKTTSRIFGGVLCSKCTAEVVKLESRIENGDMKLDDIRMKQRAFVLQLMAH